MQILTLCPNILLELGEELGCNIERVDYAEDLIMFKVRKSFGGFQIRQIANP